MVVYMEISHTSKSYLKGITQIEPEWLPALCPTLTSMSKPLPFPPPKYDAAKDRMLCSVTPTYGDKMPLLFSLL